MKNIYKIIVFTVITFWSSLFTITAQTHVSGGIYSNATWTLVNSPYIVDSNIVVFPGVTLTIQPGVVVKFVNGVSIEIRQAQLIAIGTAIDSITFTSNSLNPSPGIWNEIQLNQCTLCNQFSYCSFQYASYGIFEVICNCITISNSSFYNNSCGIYDVDGNFNSHISSCNFTYNTSGFKGGYNYYDNFISNCNFSNNTVGLGDEMGSDLEATITNCIIDSNQIGINTFSGIIDNSIIKFNQQGIQTGGSPTAIIKNCSIDSNSVEGIYINYGSGDSLYNNEIKYNGTGLISCNYSELVSCNVIQFNNIGISLFGNISNFYCNKICNNTTYNLKYNSTQNISVANNGWGSTDSATIRATIYDGYDNISLGLVFFTPVDSLNCYLTGCNLHLTTSVTNATCDTCHTGSASVTIANGHSPFTYTWNTAPIQTTQTAHNLSSGTYTVCVVDANGCTACQSVYIDSTNCNGYSITLHETNATCINCTDGKAWAVVTGGSAPYSYTWYTGPFQYTDTAINLLHGTYTVCVTDAYGCVVCDSITIGTGNCSANFLLYPDTLIQHHYWAVNQASGVPPLTYDWNWGDNTVHDFTANPSHVYANQGSYTICLTITDSVGCQNEFCQSFYLLHPKNLTPVTVNVIGSLITGITQFSTLNSQISIFPNPNDGNFTLSYHSLSSNSQFIIKDVLGRTVYTHYIYGIEGNETIDVSGLNNGIYFYQLTNSNETKEGKFVIEK